MPKQDELLEKMLRKAAKDDTLRLTIEKFEQTTIFVIKGIHDFNLQFQLPHNRVTASVRQLVTTMYDSYIKSRGK